MEENIQSNFAVAPTDLEWFIFLKKIYNNEPVNFWTPTPWKVSRMNPGDKFYFLIKKPYREIGGFGTFSRYEEMKPVEAWDNYQQMNGNPDFEHMREKIEYYKKSNNAKDYDEIGCIILSDCEFWDDFKYISKEDFKPNIVKYKYFPNIAPSSVIKDTPEDTHIKSVDRNLDIIISGFTAISNNSTVVARGTYNRTQPEGNLARDFFDWLDNKNIRVTRLGFGRLQNDIYLDEFKYLIEAKGNIKRSSIRMGIGQIIDYEFELIKRNEKLNFKGLLLPEKPDDSIINLLKSVDIKTIWQEENNFICSENWIIS